MNNSLYCLVLVVVLNSDVLFFVDITVSVSTSGKLKNCLTAVGIEPATFRLLLQCSANRTTKSSRFECVIFRSLIVVLLVQLLQSIGLANQRSRVCFPPRSTCRHTQIIMSKIFIVVFSVAKS